MKMKLYLQILFVCLYLCFGLNPGHAQCPGVCTYTEANGPFINMNGNETLCITTNTGNLSINFNGSNNVICVAPGVTWTQTDGFNFNGVTVNVYGTWVMNGGINANAASIINIYAGATFTNGSGGFGNNLTINNAGATTFTSTGQITNTGNFTFNNSAGATLTATATSLFVVGNGNNFDNYGTMTFSNLENSEGNQFYNRSSGMISISRYFYNHGSFLNEGEVETTCGALGAPTACEFVVGDKGPGQTFVNSGCFTVTGNVTFNGPGTNNADFQIVNGDLTINKPVTGTNGRFILTNGVSTINLSGSYAGTNLRICDQNTVGNGFDVVNNTPSSNLYSVDCAAFSCAASPVCSLSDAGETLEACNDNGTTANTTDDYITFRLNPVGTNLGATYSVTASIGTVTLAAGGAATGVSYGSSTAFRLSTGTANGTSITITVTDINGAPCTVTTTVQQSACSVPVACTNPILTNLTNEDICEGGSFTPANVTTSVTNGVPVSYQWYNNNGTNNPGTTAIGGQTSTTLTALPSAVGSYSYLVRATNTSDNSCFAEKTVTLVVGSIPVLSTNNSAVCAGSTTANLQTLVTGNTPVGTLSFYTSQANADAATNALLNSVVAPVNSTTYYVRSQLGGCYSTASITITANASPNPTVTNGTICSGASINLSSLVSNADGGTLSFYTLLSDAQAGTNALASSTVTPASATTYYVRSANGSGCYGVKKILVVIAAPNCDAINVSGSN